MLVPPRPLLLLQGSYGRLGLGNSDSQSTLKEIGTFPPGTVIRRLASSRGSDGHSQAITSSGEVYSWGDGKPTMFSLCPFLSLPSGVYEPVKECATTSTPGCHRNTCTYSSTIFSKLWKVCVYWKCLLPYIHR